MEVARIYMCLDTISDTRLGTLATLNEDYAVEALKNAFPVRFTDDTKSYCPSCDNDLFKEAYNNRGLTSLAKSYPTEHAVEFIDTISDLETRVMTKEPGVADKYEIIINYWPYQLSDLQVDAYVKTIRTLFKTIFPIKMVSVPLNKVTTEWLDVNNVHIAYIYSYSYWVDSVISQRLLDGQLVKNTPGITAYFPALMLAEDSLETLKSFKEEFGIIPDNFQSLTAALSQVIAIEWLNPAQYSISTRLLAPVKKPEPVSEKEAKLEMDEAYFTEQP